MLLLPFPGVFQELLPRNTLLVDALGLELRHHLALGGNRCMVSPRHPACILPVHPGLADQHIIQSIVEHMPHMQDSRHIRRRNDYGIRLSPVWFRMKKLVLKPIGVPLVLRLGRTVLSWKFHKLSMSTFCRTLRLLHKISLIRHRHGAISCKYTENIDNLTLSGGDFAGFYGVCIFGCATYIIADGREKPAKARSIIYTPAAGGTGFLPRFRRGVPVYASGVL